MNTKIFLILVVAAIVAVGCDTGETPISKTTTPGSTTTTKTDTTNANLQSNSKIPDSAKKAMHFGGGAPPAGAPPAGN